MKKISILIACLAIGLIQLNAENVSVQSPDARLTMTVNTDGALSYTVDFRGVKVVEKSSLGFLFKGEDGMAEGFKLTGAPVNKALVDEWDPVVRNKHAHIRLDYNETTLKLRETSGEYRKMDLTIRAYNDGIAFRYTLYGGSTPGDRKITRELTTFKVPEGSYAWVGHNEAKGFTGSQESTFVKTRVADMTPGEVDLLPLLVEIDKDNYLILTDACLDNFPGWYAAADNGAIITRLAPLPGEPDNGVTARFSEEITTPWRVIMVADNPGKFIESEMIRSLNPPCAIADASWIQPGMSAWDHWWSGEVLMEMPVIKQYIDLAAEQGWPYMLVDWQWYGPYNVPEADVLKEAPQIDMKEILAYAKSKGVKIWLWMYDTDVNRNDAYKKAFAEYEKWGVAGIKIDFMDRMDQEIVNWYHKIIECAAEHHLMLNFHGAYHPDGIDRTWPNQVTREGVMGEEYAKWSEYVTPSHNIDLAFTRMIGGAMDYTPGGFNNVPQGRHEQKSPAQVMNTRCAELSKFVIYESPQMCFCEHPDFVLGQPGADFLKIVPTQWDDIHFISGYPSDHIALAKRNGDKWFVGVMNNENPRDYMLDLSFLPAGKYSVEYWADGKKADKIPTELQHKTIKTDGATPIKVHMAAGGGYVAIISKL